MTLRIVSCSDHDHNAVYIDNQLVFSHDWCVESLIRVAQHLKWSITIETINSAEYERRYA